MGTMTMLSRSGMISWPQIGSTMSVFSLNVGGLGYANGAATHHTLIAVELPRLLNQMIPQVSMVLQSPFANAISTALCRTNGFSLSLSLFLVVVFRTDPSWFHA